MKKIIDFENNLQLETEESFGGETEKSPFEKWGRVALFALSAFLFAQPDFLSGLSPFVVAFVGAIPFEFCFSAFVGGALGSFACLSVGQAARVSSAVFLVCVMRLIFEKKLRQQKKEYINGGLGAFSCLISGAVYSFILNGEWSGVFSCFAESAVSFVATVVFIKAMKIPVDRMTPENLSVKDRVCIGSAFSVFLMCASAFDVEGLSPVRILSFLLILFVSTLKGVEGSVSVGVCVAFSLSINNDYRFIFSPVILASLFSGVFAPLGQTASAVAFSLVSAGLSAFSGDYGIICVIESVIASAVFIILPSKYVSAFQNFIIRKGFYSDDKVGLQVSESLQNAAENIYGVSEIVASVSEKLDNVINPEVNRLFTFLQQRVCDGCQKKFLCWNKNFDLTATDVLTLAGIEKNKKISLKKTCLKFSELTLGVDEGYREYSESLQNKLKLSEMRKVLTDQFRGMGDFLNSTALSVRESRMPDKGRAAVLKTAFQDLGIFADVLSVYVDNDSKMTVELTFFDGEMHEDHNKMKNMLEFITKHKFEKADIRVTEIKTVLTFEEKSAFRVQTGFAQFSLKQNDVCGDSVAFIKKQNGFSSVILSDGMGTGARAKIDSTMTCSIMEKLLSSGFTFESALKMVNSSLIVKSTDESISTIDALKLNLFTGEATFYKAGGCLSFIRHGNEITTIEGASLPVGIIRNVEFWKSEKELSAGDIVLLLSDGAVGEDCGWIADELLSWSTADMDDLACHIAKLSQLRMTENTRDDITVVAVKLGYNRN